jgi:hypothetical protein
MNQYRYNAKLTYLFEKQEWIFHFRFINFIFVNVFMKTIYNLLIKPYFISEGQT